ncbi:MAG: EamA family transporter [Holophaga sp.]|jgi:O-acetylserine/cysteine efflux transporter
MTPLHFLLALGTVMVWGVNYVAIAYGLRDLPPVFMAAVRFGMAAVPMVLFWPRPRAPLRYLAGYTASMFVAEFVLLYTGIKAGMPAGMAALVMQLHVFLTLALALVLLGERPRPAQWAGAAIAFAGVAVVGWHMPTRGSFAGFGMVVAASLCWALGNHFTKKIGPVDPLAMSVWCGVAAAPALLAVSALLEGPAAIRYGIHQFSLRTLAALLFQAYVATLFAFSGWCYLMRRYPAATIAPLSMLIPLFSMASGAVFLGEPITLWKGASAVLVLAGLALNQATTSLAERASGLGA